MPKFIHTTYTMLLLACLMLAAPQSFSASKMPNKQQLYTMLQANQHEAVRALSTTEREILLAKLALDAGNDEQAITFLSTTQAGEDPLAALIKAEAYRRQSVKAAIRAGRYAHSADGDINKLKNAKLDSALKLADQRLLAFMNSLNKPKETKAPVIKTPEVKPEPVAAEKAYSSAELLDGVRAEIEQWRKDWQSLNADAYLSHYHQAFKTPKHTLKTWSTYKRRVNGRKSFIQVLISNLKVLEAPRQNQYGTTMLVEFDQEYKSSNYAASSRKRLLLVRSGANAKWQILFEGDRTQPVSKFNKTQLSPNQSATGSSTVRAERINAKWAINLGSFSSKSNADSMAYDINVPPGEKQPFVSTITSSSGHVQYRVRIGLFDTRDEAVNTMLEACPALGLSDCWLEQVK
ncbi:sporulation related domain protein [Mariprofundus micogutta]|uniref:Sporulation related domain protein n=1 Tax=Mariprofundus micogutta TaxID=1921010 RepID=A0A1L8CK48_9PROT|nr:SPOR domain-containing protein [Mariprofundus micogutta]GAV19282.1 sporulation related domain protein [Mariprofundus micogutta]